METVPCAGGVVFSLSVIPAKAGIQRENAAMLWFWVPAFPGMTRERGDDGGFWE